MGIEIILIMIFHYCKNVIDHATKLNGGETPAYDGSFVRWMNRWIGASGVDIFLLVSGLGLYYSWRKRNKLKEFYKRRFTRILIPYFIIALPTWLVLDFILQPKWRIIFLPDLFMITPFIGRVLFWYIPMAAICYLIFPLVYKVVEGNDKINKFTNAFVRILLLSTIFIIAAFLMRTYFYNYYDKVNVFINRFPAFFFGVLIGKYSYEQKKIKIFGFRPGIYAVIVLFILLVIASNIWKLPTIPIVDVHTRTLLNLMACLMAAYILDLLINSHVFLLHSMSNVIIKFFSWFGKYSLELYLLHVALRYPLMFLNVPKFPIYRLHTYLLVIMFALALALSVNRMTEVVNKQIDKLSTNEISR